MAKGLDVGVSFLAERLNVGFGFLAKGLDVGVGLLAQGFDVGLGGQTEFFDVGADFSMSAWVARLLLRRLTCSSAKASACCSVKPFSVRCLTNLWVSKLMASLAFINI